MRLICPNCEAEYEVDDAAIPDMGRDVQCSNCGHAWFQLPPEIELALEQEDELFGGEGAMADPVIPDEQDAELPAPAPAAEAPRRSVDENLLAILREEAEREAAARKAEAAPIETQPDLGLPPASAAPAATAATAATAAAAGAGMGAVARRIAQLKGIDPDAPPAVPPKPPARRDLLPDIEEINSSLKAESPQDGEERSDDQIATDNARGFRRGFAVAMVIAVIGLAAYVSAPRIAAMVPALDGPVQAYVGAVDAARLWLDATMRAATDSLRGLSGQETSGS